MANHPPNPSPSQFLSYLSSHEKTPTRELLQPYLSYETSLRKAFANGDADIDSLANMVAAYDGHENLFRIRTIDRETAGPEKYLMPLADSKREANGVPAIAASMKDYQKNFRAFTHGVLAGIDWSNVVVAGSAALLPLLSHREGVGPELCNDQTVENSLEVYFQTIASGSDIDIFLYGIESEDAAITRIIELEAAVRRRQRLVPGKGLSLRSKHAITFIAPKGPYRHVQVILRLYRSISEILTGFDVDCACVAFDGERVYTNPRGVAAIATRTNTIDLTRRSPSYENRLRKYRDQGFEVFWDCLERSRIKDDLIGELDSDEWKYLTGLARILDWERRTGDQHDYTVDYFGRRGLRRIDDGGDPALVTNMSGYATHVIPSSAYFTAARIKSYVKKHSTEPFRFGTIRQVMGLAPIKDKKRGEQLGGKVTFMKDNPGRQMIGSFYPLTEDDW
ncbi:ankyrin repeat protein [Podospora didyma]|uniref:Ankyrin repeat protein n=1 Tax=Podospora didyma TaxID=330526 RepID=A0AAE0TVT1_9PEZI|nr:ankyrin repeat protein [Podospora didyma]